MSFMKQFIVSTLLILGVVSFMVIFAGGNYRASLPYLQLACLIRPQRSPSSPPSCSRFAAVC